MLNFRTIRTKAFTLLELIVVIVILGILAAIAVPTFRAVIARSQDSATQASLLAYDREARALAAFENRSPTMDDYRDAAADLDLSSGAGTHAAAAVFVEGLTGVTSTNQVGVEVRGPRAGIVMLSASGSCVLLQSESGTTAVFVRKAGTCTGSAALDGRLSSDVVTKGDPTVNAPAPAAFSASAAAASGKHNTGSMATYTVPVTGLYKVEAWGAQGGTLGSATGGRGASASGTVNLTAGTVVRVAVGKQGESGRVWGGGGGGGTFVFTGTTALVVAGGGGGGNSTAGGPGLAGTSGGSTAQGTGGTDGGGGARGGQYGGGGGAGFLGMGTAQSGSFPFSATASTTSAAYGGHSSQPDYAGYGGFGGGAAAGSAGGGGGGGYSGGAGSLEGGGGGGSYVHPDATAPVTTGGVNTGDGRATITFIN